jgi:hypothetical protein
MPKAISILPAGELFAASAAPGAKPKEPVDLIRVTCLVLVQFLPGEAALLHPGEDFAVIGYVPGETLFSAEDSDDFLGYLGPDEPRTIYAEAAKQRIADREAKKPVEVQAAPAPPPVPKAKRVAQVVAEPIPSAPASAPEATTDSPIANRSLT